MSAPLPQTTVYNNGVGTTSDSSGKVIATNIPAPTPVASSPNPYTGPNGPKPNSQFVQSGAPGTTSVPSITPTITPTSNSPITGTPAQSPTTMLASSYNSPQGSYQPPAPLTEDDVYKSLLSQGQGVIDSIQQGYDTQISATTNADTVTGNQAQEDQNAMSAASGLLGSSSAIAGSDRVKSATQDKIQTDTAPLIAGRQKDVATALQTIASNAQSLYPIEEEQQQQQLSNAQDAIKTLANAEVDWDSFKGTPQYDQLVQQLGGDPNYADALFTMNKPVGTVDPNLSKVLGNTYYQVTRDPVTGAMNSSSFSLPYTPPTNWVAQKVSTTTLLMQDPNNASNSILYTTDPISGQVQVSGTGSGADLASQYNASAASNSSTDSSGAASPAASQNYITTATTTAGIADATQPFADAVIGQNGVGLGSLVAGIQNAEGGSPTGVQNNPGNVKYVPGMANATDSGVQATDGGTFASFTTPQAGEQAIGGTLTSIAQGLGPDATVQDVLNKYANLGSSSSTDTESGVSTAQYGALANVPGFNPNAAGDQGIIDKDAYSYLKLYLSGTQPSNTNLTGKRSSSSAEFQQAQNRAQDLYFKATGKQLPNITEQTANLGFLNANNALLNSLTVQEGTIQANSDLMQGNINAENINQHAPVINKVLDGIQESLGDPNVSSYLAQNSTLSNELGSLLALKNASGTTVHDKLISADLIDPTASAAQEAKVVNTLMQEAGNAHTAISIANAKLFQNTDPLGVDPANPLSNPTQFAQTIGLDLAGIQRDNPSLTPEQILNQYLEQN